MPSKKSSSGLFDTQWAPIFFEPLPESGERVTIALVARNSVGDFRCASLLDPAAVRLLFKDERKYARDVISLVIESFEAFLATDQNLETWEPPLSGLYLGRVQSTKVSSVAELLRFAAPMSSFMYRPTEYDVLNDRPTSKQWDTSVSSILLQSNARYRQNLNVPVYLGTHEAPATFTFLSPALAASLVALSEKRLKLKIEEARAKLWALDLLSDAPSWLFRPKVRDLIAGVGSLDGESNALINEAVAELRDEAERRGVGVTVVTSPEDAASHILNRAQAA